MSIKRRKRIGQSLLIAGAGASLSMACGEKESISGNLMPPPEYEFCIDVEPDNADVLVNSSPMADGDCTSIYEGSSAIIEATAEGYEDYSEEVVVWGDVTHTIEMLPTGNVTEEDTGE